MENNQPKLGFINGINELNDSINYSAPEILIDSMTNKVNEKVDIYAIGCLIYEMSQLKPLFDGKEKEDIVEQQKTDLKFKLNTCLKGMQDITFR